jgi:hypothetical protein
MSERTTRIEQSFHSTIWNAADEWMRCERAIAEGRDLAYVLLDESLDDGLKRDLANRWLDTFGRDARKESSS